MAHQTQSPSKGFSLRFSQVRSHCLLHMKGACVPLGRGKFELQGEAEQAREAGEGDSRTSRTSSRQIAGKALQQMLDRLLQMPCKAGHGGLRQAC